MEDSRTKTVKTTKGVLEYSICPNTGKVLMKNPQTTEAYYYIQNAIMKGRLSPFECIKIIKKNCDPQEVYFCEYNDGECYNLYGGDSMAIESIIDIYGEKVAESIQRMC